VTRRFIIEWGHRWQGSKNPCRETHDWRYAGSAYQQPQDEYPLAQIDFSGFIEECSRCGVVRQIPA
jgi:hypothetical protein